MELTYLALCSCGAYSFQINNNTTATYSIHKDNMILLPQEIIKQINNYDTTQTGEYYGCNHCDNNWGLDLCACGSGEPFNRCEEGHNECGNPMQNIEEGYNHVSATDAWKVIMELDDLEKLKNERQYFKQTYMQLFNKILCHVKIQDAENYENIIPSFDVNALMHVALEQCLIEHGYDDVSPDMITEILKNRKGE